MIVHHLEHSRSQRILWLLEELGLDYEVRRYARDPRTRLAPAELLAVHPLGKSPVLTDGQLTIAETGAIIEHLCEHYDPSGTLGLTGPDAASTRYWLHYAEGSAMPVLLLARALGGLTEPAAAALRSGLVEPDLVRHQRFWEDSLARSGWFTGGAFGAADIAMSFPAEALAKSPSPPGPRTMDFVTRIHARPAYARALAKGGPYGFA